MDSTVFDISPLVCLIQRSYKGHTKVIQRSYEDHTKVIQRSYKGHTKVIQKVVQKGVRESWEGSPHGGDRDRYVRQQNIKMWIMYIHE